MVTITRTAEIHASTDEIWVVLSDFAAISRWAPNVDHSCLLSEQTEGVGTVRRIQTGRTTVVETVGTWEPGAELGYEITGLPPVIRSVTNTWRLEPDGDHTVTTLTSEIDAGPRPPQKAAARVVARTLGKASEQMLGGLVACIEAARTERAEQS